MTPLENHTAVNISSRNSYTQDNLDDLFGLTLISQILGGQYLPITTSSIRPIGLATLLNDIAINQYQRIVEFGSGISTILIGRLIKRNRFPTKLHTIEHDESWAKVIFGYMKREKLTDMAKIIHAPLTNCELALDYNLWYDEEILKLKLKGLQFDLVIIDGPPTFGKLKDRSRYPALPFIRSYLKENYTIYIDDSNRAGEMAILKEWKTKFRVDFNHTHGSMAVYTTMNHFNPKILK